MMMCGGPIGVIGGQGIELFGCNIDDEPRLWLRY